MIDHTIYAERILKYIVNLKPNEEILINAPIEAEQLVAALTKLAYESFNSGYVHVNYFDEFTNEYKLKYANEAVLEAVPNYILARYDTIIKNNGVMLNIIGNVPKPITNVDIKRLKKTQQSWLQKVRPFEAHIYNKLKHASVLYPTKNWAKKVYPKLSEIDAVENLHNALTAMLYLDQPQTIIEAKIEALTKRMKTLDSYQFKQLKVTTKFSELTLDLIADYQTQSYHSEHKEGSFIKQYPFDKIVITPHKYGTNGTISVMAPIHFQNKLIKPFQGIIKDGKLVEIKQGDKNFIKLLERFGDSALYIGELGFIEGNLPLQELKTIFYQRALDETRGTYLALGQSNPKTLKKANTFSKEGLIEKGLNYSPLYMPLVLQDDTLDIEGVTNDNEIISIMEDGQFVSTFK